MPFGQFERAARAGRGDLYPQTLLGRQVYWTVVGETVMAPTAVFVVPNSLLREAMPGDKMDDVKGVIRVVQERRPTISHQTLSKKDRFL